MVLARKGGSFSKVSHLAAPASATYRGSSQPSAKTDSPLDTIWAQSEIAVHDDDGDEHCGCFGRQIARLKRVQMG